MNEHHGISDYRLSDDDVLQYYRYGIGLLGIAPLKACSQGVRLSGSQAFTNT